MGKEEKKDENVALLEKYNQVYLEIIMRYKDYIEENENLYVAELPKLITPDNENVVWAANKIKSSFPSYEYDDNFLDAARMAYNYVKNEIATVNLPIQFWLKPEGVIRCGAGDLFDKATLLCSVLIALGNISTKLLIKVDDSERKLIVYSEFKGSIIAFDMEDGFVEYKSKEDLLKSIGVGKGGDITVYEFNDKLYNSIA